MNFIFDIGNVLITFQPKKFLHILLNHPQHVNKMIELIFKSKQWIQLDKGTITHEQACSNFCSKEPEYNDVIKKVMDSLANMLLPMEKSIAWLSKIKEQGHKLYYLSNYHEKLSKFIMDQYSFFELFDGGVFSCDIHTIKPYPKIYHYILNKYALDPRNCVFFDDTKENIDAATKLGIDGVLFTDARDIEEYFISAL